MFNPKYSVLLNKECFYPDQAVCLGYQLIKIIKFLSKFTLPHVWFIADIDAYNSNCIDFEIGSPFLKEIGDDCKIINFSSFIQQFSSGVFISIKTPFPIAGDKETIINDLKIATDDLPFRPIPLDNIQFEIRAVDTSFFSIYSESEDLIKKLAKNFHTPIEILF